MPRTRDVVNYGLDGGKSEQGPQAVLAGAPPPAPGLSSLVMRALLRKPLPRARGVVGWAPESSFPTSLSWVVSEAANPGCMALSQA